MTRYQKLQTKLAFIQTQYLGLEDESMDKLDELLDGVVMLIHENLPPAELSVTVYEAKKETYSFDEWQSMKQT